MPPIFDFPYDFAPYDHPVVFRREWEQAAADLGQGHEKGVLRGVAQSRSDGTGQIASYKGRNAFLIEIGQAEYYGAQLFRLALRFLQARKDAGLEAFYFYSFLENPDRSTWTGDAPSSGLDLDGNAIDNTVGRYLVRHMADSMQWRWQTRFEPDILQLEFLEVFN